MPADVPGERTPLPPQLEVLFQRWARDNGITDVDDPRSFYDYRGHFLQTGGGMFMPTHGAGAAPVQFGVDDFPDTFKQHGHPRFSVESKYSRGPSDGGRWIGEDTLVAPPMPSHSTPALTPGPQKESTHMDWIVTRNGKRYTFPEDADETDIRGALGGDYQVEQRPGGGPAPMASHGGDPASGQTVPDDSGTFNESAGAYPAWFGETIVNHLPELAAAGTAPFTGGLSLLPAAAMVGGAGAAGSLVRSGINRNQSVGEALGDATTAGLWNAGGEGVLRGGIGAAKNLLGRAARTGARTILSSAERPASPAVVETALREKLLPMARSGEYLTDKAMRETADTASTQLGGQLIPGTKGVAQPYTPAGATTFRVRTHPREVHEASATLRQLLDQSAVEPAIRGTIRAARNVNAGSRAPVGAVARNAFGTATRAASDLSPRGVMQRAYATGDLRTGADALRDAAEPGAAATLDRFREMMPVRTAYAEAGPAARRIVQDPRALPTSPINLARQAFRAPRLIGPGARTAYAASNVPTGVASGALRGAYQGVNTLTDNGLDEIRQAIIDGLIRPMPSH